MSVSLNKVQNKDKTERSFIIGLGYQNLVLKRSSIKIWVVFQFQRRKYIAICKLIVQEFNYLNSLIAHKLYQVRSLLFQYALIVRLWNNWSFVLND